MCAVMSLKQILTIWAEKLLLFDERHLKGSRQKRGISPVMTKIETELISLVSCRGLFEAGVRQISSSQGAASFNGSHQVFFFF